MATKKVAKKAVAPAVEKLAIDGGKKVWSKGFPAWPQFNPKTDKKVLDILHSGKVNYWTGPVGMQFEAAWAKWLGVKNAISVSNGTAALHVALTQNVRLRDGGDTLLEIAGEDGVFYPAETEIRARELVLSHAAVPRPVQARYAWTDYAIVRLFGENGLPLAPFWLK